MFVLGSVTIGPRSHPLIYKTAEASNDSHDFFASDVGGQERFQTKNLTNP